MTSPILSSRFSDIDTPLKLRRLARTELPGLTRELREELIESVSASGGHFASSLGVAELTVALHYLFDTPRDRIVWDVGHQAYVHKMLTGRRAELATVRQGGGLSGFLKRCESEFDCFGAGHAGTSISAAAGMRIGLAPDAFAVAVIGDGSLTAGMAFEALNHLGAFKPDRTIVILNDNGMSISTNVGALHRAELDGRPDAARHFFTSLGLRYIGHVDGHDFDALFAALSEAKNSDGPCVVHVRTQKGRGHAPAEADPVAWHGITARPAAAPAPHAVPKPAASTYTSIFADALLEIARRDPRVRAVTAAMPTGTGLDKIACELPGSFIDTGISEQHAVALAAGMAAEGLRPVCAIYSTFLQRAYDQVVHDVCIQNLPVVFALDRGGAVGNDGETHQGVFDIAALRAIPNMVVMSPKDGTELRSMLYSAFAYSCPVAIRYPRGNAAGGAVEGPAQIISPGRAEVAARGADGVIVAFGPLVGRALQVRELLLNRHGLEIAIINARFAKPLDEELLSAELPKYPFVCTLEDHALAGGFGSAVLELANDLRLALQAPIHRLGIRDHFLPHASQDRQHEMCGLDAESICGLISSSLVKPRAKRAA